MEPVCNFGQILRRAFYGRVVLRTLIFSLLVTAAAAKPVTYTGFTIADGKLGSWEFHNSRVYLTFKSDARSVQVMQFANSDNPALPATITLNPTGKASVTIISGDETVHATFAPGQIFVSLDLGDSQNPGSRGVGFGSYGANGAVEPAYPLGIKDGTIDRDNAGPDNVHQFSQELTDLSTDLKHDTGFSGRAWECVGFGNNPSDPTCTAPTPFKTDKGDFYLFQRYRLADADVLGDSLSGGFFTAVVGGDDDEDASISPPPWAPRRGDEEESARPITYTAFLISDVAIGDHQYAGAQIYLSFDADAGTVMKLADGTGHTYINDVGKAHVRVISGDRTITAQFAPDQIYVFFDEATASVGFGSHVGGHDYRGYPLTLTQLDCDSLTENSTVGAISDIAITPANAANYTAPTALLPADLVHATTISGPASSCVAFDPATSICSDFNPVPLKTNRGDFTLFEPYTDFDTTCTPTGPLSVNWGTFWAETGRGRR